MTIYAVGTDAHGNAAGTTVSATYPSGIAAGNIICVAVCSNQSITTPSGYTAIDSNTSGSLTVALFAKIADGTESGTLSVTLGSSALSAIFIMVRRSDVGFNNVAASPLALSNISAVTKNSTTSAAALSTTAISAIPWQADVFAVCGALRSATSVDSCTLSGTDWQNAMSDGATASITALSAGSGEDPGDWGSNGTAATFTFAHTNSNLASIAWYIKENGPTFLSGAFGTNASGASISVPMPASLTAGNTLIIAVMTGPSTSSFSTLSGWTTLVLPGNGVLYAKIADGTETSQSISWTTNAVSAYASIQMSNCYGALPDEYSAVLNSLSTNYTAPAVSPGDGGCTLLNIYFGRSANTITLPSGQTSITSTVTGNSMSVRAAYEYLGTVSGVSTGTRVATGTSAVNMGVSIAIRPPTSITRPRALWCGGWVPTPTFMYHNGDAQSAGPGLELFGFGPGFGFAYNGNFGTSVDGNTPLPTQSGYNVKVGQCPNVQQSVNAQLSPTGPQKFYPGTGVIQGTCYANGGPYSGAIVYLSSQDAPSNVIASAMTDSNGTYTFYNLGPGYYIVEGFDPSGTYNGVVQTFITPFFGL